MGWFDWLVISPCVLCQRSLQPGQRCFCVDCQNQLQSQRHQPWCDRENHPPLYIWGVYKGSLQRALMALKYKNQPEVGVILGEWMGQVWQGVARQSDRSRYALVPIPLHPERFKERGYNQAERIAQGFAQITGFRTQANVLERIRSTERQRGLSAVDRQQNLAGAFGVARLPKEPVLIVDDIYTTGATVINAVTALESKGAKVAGIVVVARPLLQPAAPDLPLLI